MVKSLHWKELPEFLRGRMVESTVFAGTPKGEKSPTEPKKEKREKYHRIKTTVDGIVFDSKKEAAYYCELKVLQKAGEVISFDMQVKYPYVATYTNPDDPFSPTHEKKGFYRADFVVRFKDGRVQTTDVKGARLADYKKKKKIIEKLYGIEIIEK